MARSRSYVGTDLLDSMEKYGLKGLAFMENGFRQVTSSQGANIVLCCPNVPTLRQKSTSHGSV